MGALNKSQVEAKLLEFGKLRKKQASIEAARDKKIEAEEAKFDRACKPINDEAARTLAPVLVKITALDQEIKDALNAGIDRKTKKHKIKEVVAGLLRAFVKETKGNRVLAPLKFFKAVPEAQRTPEFWACVKVGNAAAIKFLGESKFDKLADAETKFEAVIEEVE